MSSIEKIKILTGNENDALIELCLEEAQSEFLEYTNLETVPATANSIIEELAIIRLNTIGAEGLASQSYSGNSESYLTTYSDAMRARLNRYRRIKVL